MPNEILLAVIDLAGSKSLPALRLTNKRLCSASNTAFATLHFTERRHVQTAYSMDALTEITAHPFFGQFVRTVIISGVRPKLGGNPLLNGVPRTCIHCVRQRTSPFCKHLNPEHVVLNFDQVRDRLHEALSNIRRLSCPISVGVCDSTRSCYGSALYNKHCLMITDWHLVENKLVSSQPKLTHYMETYTEVLQAAQEADCQIEGTVLRVSTMSYPYATSSDEEREEQDRMRHFFDSLSNNLSFEFSFGIREYCPSEYQAKYNHQTGELDVSGLLLASDYSLNPDIARMLTRLSAKPMKRIRLSDIDLGDTDFLMRFCGPTLEKLTLHDVTFHTYHFDTNLWSSFLHQLSRTTNLKYLELSQCQYGICWEENEDVGPDDERAWFELPSGLYHFDPEIHDIERFYLAPSGDVREKIILSDREDISVQLKELADQVAQLEVDKVADIERKGLVRNDIVGTPEDNTSDEDDSSDEDASSDEDDSSDEEDDDSVQNSDQDETKDTNDEHSKNSTNDDQLELTP